MSEIPSTARSVSSKNLPNPNMVKRSIKKGWNLKIKTGIGAVYLKCK